MVQMSHFKWSLSKQHCDETSVPINNKYKTNGKMINPLPRMVN